VSGFIRTDKINETSVASGLAGPGRSTRHRSRPA